MGQIRLRNFDVINKYAKNYSQKELGMIYDILTSSERLKSLIITTPSLAYLEELLSEHKDFRPDILGIGGGDGTASQTLTFVKRTWQGFPEYIAPFAMGTMNDYALPLGLDRGLLQQVGISDTPPVRMARYIRDSVDEGKDLRTGRLSLLEVNDRCGFNIGFGLVPKLLWLYYGRTIEQHRRLEKEMWQASPDRYERIFGKITSERSVLENLIDIVSQGNGSGRSGAVSSIKAGFTGIKGALAGALGFDSRESDFFSEPLEVDIFIEGNLLSLPRPPTAIMTASYRQMNLGIRGLYPIPLPEAQGSPGKMQVVVTWLSPSEVITQIPALFRGKHMRRTKYYHAKDFRVSSRSPIPCIVDGDFIYGTDFRVKFDQDLKFISLR
jgi:diacylglycerol kinase family enzyme